MADNMETLVNAMTIEDPMYYSKPFTVTFTARLQGPSDEILENICQENNQYGPAGGHQNPFANFYLVDLLVSQHQKCIAGGKRHRLPRLERQTLLFERIGSDGLLQI